MYYIKTKKHMDSTDIYLFIDSATLYLFLNLIIYMDSKKNLHGQ